jgi:hypothetical protein
MSLFSHIHPILRLGAREGNQGVCIVWKCPRCQVDRDYLLIRSKGNVTFLGIEFSRLFHFLHRIAFEFRRASFDAHSPD